MNGPIKDGMGNYLTPDLQTAMSVLSRSPSSQNTPVALLTPSIKRSAERLVTPLPQPTSQRMHHNIPHRFVTGLNTRATKCGVCLGSVQFVKQAAKCQGQFQARITKVFLEKLKCPLLWMLWPAIIILLVNDEEEPRYGYNINLAWLYSTCRDNTLKVDILILKLLVYWKVVSWREQIANMLGIQHCYYIVLFSILLTLLKLYLHTSGLFAIRTY